MRNYFDEKIEETLQKYFPNMAKLIIVVHFCLKATEKKLY